jgi:hypothetical protein
LPQAQLDHSNHAATSLADIRRVIDRVPVRFIAQSVRQQFAGKLPIGSE